MNKSENKWKSTLKELGHPQVESWDDKTYNAALFRNSKERKDLLNWLAPKILELSGHTKKFPDEITLPDVYSQFVFMQKEEIWSFMNGSLLKDKQVEIWSNIFWKMDIFRETPQEETRLPEEEMDKVQIAFTKAEEMLSKPLPQLELNVIPPGENREVSQDELISKIKNFYAEACSFKLLDPTASLDVDLTALKNLSQMVESMKRMHFAAQ